MVREWAHNPTLNGSIPNSSLIIKLVTTKNIFQKTRVKIKKNAYSIKLTPSLSTQAYNNYLMRSKYLSITTFHLNLNMSTSTNLYLFVKFIVNNTQAYR
jgi:hypothetical protein